MGTAGSLSIVSGIKVLLLLQSGNQAIRNFFWCWRFQLPGTTGRKVPNLLVLIDAIQKNVRSSH